MAKGLLIDRYAERTISTQADIILSQTGYECLRHGPMLSPVMILVITPFG